MIFNKLARYAIILIIVIISAIHLPNFYNKTFIKKNNRPRISYSSITKDFIYFTRKNGQLVFSDLQKNIYTRKEYERYLPFIYYRDLQKWGVLPDSIQGFPTDIPTIHQNSARYRFRGQSLDRHEIKIYPLIESEPDFANLTFPPNVFRITDKIEFINAKNNNILIDKSFLYNQAFEKQNFRFPAKMIAGNPTTKKSFDEGYFIIDNENSVFHLKKIKSQPFLVKTPISQDLQIKKIIIQEAVSKKVYGFLITENNKLFMISYDNYRLIPISLNEFQATNMNLNITVNPLYVTFNYDDNYNFFCAVFDSNYNKIDDMKISLLPKNKKTTEMIKHIIFPFTIKITKNFSSLKYFSLDLHSSLSFIGILISLIIGFFVKIKRNENLKVNWFDFIFILFSGIYGLIGILLIKSDIWE